MYSPDEELEWYSDEVGDVPVLVVSHEGPVAVEEGVSLAHGEAGVPRVHPHQAHVGLFKHNLWAGVANVPVI